MRRSAFALVAVLVTLAAASAGASVAAVNARTDLAQARASLTRAQMSAAIEGALAETVATLTAADAKPVALDGRPILSTTLGTIRVVVRVLPEAARLDLNRAAPSQIARLCEAVGVRASAGNRAARWIESRRGAPFVSVVELARAFEDSGAFLRVAPYLTIRGLAASDTRFAPEPVLAASGLDAGARGALLAARPESARVNVGPTLGALAVFLEATGEGDAVRVEERVIAFSGRGFVLLERRPGEEANILPAVRP